MPGLELERLAHLRGSTLVAGVDEAGRGPLAGPVMAAAVILPAELSGAEPWLAAIDDSKRLSEKRREEALELIRRHALAVAVAQQDADDIDALGILPATIQAMTNALHSLRVEPEYVLFDYLPLKACPFAHQTVVKGDSISYSIAAASIVAKVTRDRWMQRAERQYPGYGFAQHKGYPTRKHIERMQVLGPCSIHRRSYRPVRACGGDGISGGAGRIG